ncbi:hypothetical protein CRUP_020137 [Coryphaenoides rupestris]|nr:hypothetical protein CRUP_020137 [Coryphaenoides rupestris]
MNLAKYRKTGHELDDAEEWVEQRVQQLLDVTQHSIPDEMLQTQVQNKGLQVQIESLQHQNDNRPAQMSSQAPHISHFEELQRKSLDDALNAERSSEEPEDNMIGEDSMDGQEDHESMPDMNRLLKQREELTKHKEKDGAGKAEACL